MFFAKFETCLSITSLHDLLALFFFLYFWVLALLLLSYMLLKFISSPSLSFLSYSDWVNSIELLSSSLILSSVISTLLLDPSSEIFIPIIAFLSYITAIIFLNGTEWNNIVIFNFYFKKLILLTISCWVFLFFTS